MSTITCEACGVSLVKDEVMPQTVEQWQYMHALTEQAMLRDKKKIERLKMKINQLKQKQQRWMIMSDDTKYYILQAFLCAAIAFQVVVLVIYLVWLGEWLWVMK